eukprot:m.301457 g.301457  ORF g.301457 m.301457 type:complete len:1383 (+) comp55224_c0_seq8:392-4540(+)
MSEPPTRRGSKLDAAPRKSSYFDAFASARSDLEALEWVRNDNSDLPNSSKQSVVRSSGHTFSVAAISFDGQLLATAGSKDKDIRVSHWQNKSLQHLQNHKEPVTAICFSPKTANVIVSGSQDKSVILWTLPENESSSTAIESRVLGSHEDVVLAIAVSHDGLRAVSCGADSFVNLWLLSSHGPPEVFSGHQLAVTDVCFSVDDQFVASVSKDKTLRVWSTAPRTTTTPSASWVASDEDAEPDRMRVIEGHPKMINSLAISPRGSHIATGAVDMKVRIWDLGDEVPEAVVLEGHRQPVMCVRYSPTGKLLVSVSADELRIWQVGGSPTDMQSNVQIFSLAESSAHTASFTPDGEAVVLVCEHDMFIYHVMKTTDVTTIDTQHPIQQIAVSAGSEFVAAVHGTVISLHHYNASASDELTEFSTHTNTVNSVAFSPDASLLVSTSEDKTVRLWNTKNHADVRILEGHTGAVLTACISGDNMWVVSAGMDGLLCVWNMATFQRSILKTDGVAKAVGFSDDGSILCVCVGTAVQLWLMSEITNPGETTFAGGRARILFVETKSRHNVSTCKLLAAPMSVIGTLETKSSSGDSNPASSRACFSRDASLLAVGYKNGLAQIWQLGSRGSGQLLSSMRLAANTIRTLQFSADGKYLFAGTGKKTYVWQFGVDGAVCILKGSHGTPLANGEYVAVLKEPTQIAFISCEYVQRQTYQLDQILQHGTVENLLGFLKTSCFDVQTRFCWQGLPTDIALRIVENRSVDSDYFEGVLAALPDLGIYNIGFQPDTSLRNAFFFAVQAGLRRHVQVMIDREAARLANKQSQIFDYYYECYPFTRALPLLAKRFPELATLMISSFLLDVTTSSFNRGPHARINFLSDSATRSEFDNPGRSSAMLEPIRHKVVLLPEFAQASQTHKPEDRVDVLKALSNNDVLTAFTTPAVRATIDYRWDNIHRYFYLQFFLYLGLLATTMVFSFALAKDDTSASLSDRYSDDVNRAALACGIVSVLLSIWFFSCELMEILAEPKEYIEDVWSMFDMGANLTVFATAILHILRDDNQYAVGTVAVLLVWFKMLSFLRGFRGAGVFIRLVFLIAYEIRYFLLIWFIVMLGFANAYIIMFRENADSFRNMGTAFLYLFQASNNILDLYFRPIGSNSGGFPFADSTGLYNLQLFLFLLFTLSCNVVLLNLLIALMSSVFNDTVQVAAPSYRLEKSKLILNLELVFIDSIIGRTLTACIQRFQRRKAQHAWLHIVAGEHRNTWRRAAVKPTEEALQDLTEKLDSFVQASDQNKGQSTELAKSVQELTFSARTESAVRPSETWRTSSSGLRPPPSDLRTALSAIIHTKQEDLETDLRTMFAKSRAEISVETSKMRGDVADLKFLLRSVLDSTTGF